MIYQISAPESIKKTDIKITGSKSISNRLLILQKLFNDQITIENLSKSDDTTFLKQCLESTDLTLNVGLAGTSMRFMVSYLAVKATQPTILTGLEALKKRPIKILVDALRTLGADIKYLNETGYPPIEINGTPLNKTDSLSIDAGVSSQYITSLMLIASKLKNGLKINLSDIPTSKPYLDMTISILNKIGIQTSWEGNCIQVFPKKILDHQTVSVEPDWSGASYFYSLITLSEEGKITLTGLQKNSLQGDREVSNIYENFGVSTEFITDGIIISKQKDFRQPQSINLDLTNTPDLAQTIAVTCLGIGIKCNLTGLHTLKIKETDRLLALKTEIEKLGASVTVDEKSLQLNPCNTLNENTTIDTYHDHRMAMAFAPLALKINLNIRDPKVVSKSYPSYWDDLKKTGFLIQNIQG